MKKETSKIKNRNCSKYQNSLYKLFTWEVWGRTRATSKPDWMTDIMEFMKCKMKQIQLQIKTRIQIRIDSCYLIIKSQLNTNAITT